VVGLTAETVCVARGVKWNRLESIASHSKPKNNTVPKKIPTVVTNALAGSRHGRVTASY
jgi:hypothetical protein